MRTPSTQNLLNVTSFLLFETGTYDDQYRRPISSSIDGSHLAKLQESTGYGQNLTPNALSAIASEILMPATEIESNLNILNGWGTRRYHFILEVSSGNTNYGNFRKVLTGYTDTADRSFKNTLDPNMCLFINGHITLRDVNTMTKNGPRIVTNIVSNDQILIGGYSRNYNGQNEHALRPGDVLRRLGTDRMMQEQDPDSIGFNMVTTFATGIKNNSRKNNNSGVYLSRLLSAYRDSETTADQFLDSPVATFDNAAAVLGESLFSDDSVFSAINRVTDFTRQGFITLMQLEQLCPGAEQRATVHVHSGVHSVRPPSVAGSVSGWQGNNLETVMATKLSHSLPGILLDSALNRISLVMTNMTVDGSYDIRVVDGTIGSIIRGIDYIQMAEQVKIKIAHQLMPGLTKNGLLGVFIRVDCDTMSETRISISVDGNHQYDYVSPTFADALLSPIITSNSTKVEQLVNDVHNLSSNLTYNNAGSNNGNSRIYTGNETAPTNNFSTENPFSGRFL